MKYMRYFCLVILGFVLVGCASMKIPEPTVSIENLEKLRAANIKPTHVGPFSLAADKPKSMDTSLGGLRGASIKPANGLFSQQLKDTLIAELKGAGFYDESSEFTIKGELTDSKVDAAIKKGSARLAARFIVDDKSETVYDKELSVDSTWESSFVGAIAVPEAINQYTALYKVLIGKLFDDPDFVNAVKAE